MLLIAPLLLAVLGSPVQQDEGDTIQELAPPKNYFQLIDIDRSSRPIDMGTN